MITEAGYLIEKVEIDFSNDYSSNVNNIMKIKINLVLNVFLILIWVMSSCSSLRYEKHELLDKMDKLVEASIDSRINRIDRYLFKQHSLVRESLLNEIQDIILRNDTIILLCARSIQSGDYYGSVWTPNQSLNYNTRDGIDSIQITKNQIKYSDFIISNVLRQNWNIIKERQKEQGAALGGNLVHVFYIRNINEEYYVDYFKFAEFLDSLSMPY